MQPSRLYSHTGRSMRMRNHYDARLTRKGFDRPNGVQFHRPGNSQACPPFAFDLTVIGAGRSERSKGQRHRQYGGQRQHHQQRDKHQTQLSELLIKVCRSFRG
ncbi:hypothetical protein PputUW4_03136 [Pseudomonas sp. UW4]|nr:hypothetical protein PputUW4_03136 [Pseudomonas sp. UW4]